MANEQEDLQSLLGEINGILSKTDLSNVTEDSAGFKELPEGYFLCDVVKAEIKRSKSSKKPQAVLQLKVVEDGLKEVLDADGEVQLVKAEKTKGITVFKYYPLDSEEGVQRFASDMMKFEDPDNPGKHLLEKDAFTNAAYMMDAVSCLVDLRINVQNTINTKNDGTKSSWLNLITWKRADKIFGN